MLFVARDISSQKKYEDTLLHDGYFDVLTNLPNRRKLNELLVEAKSKLKEQRYFAVLLMDIDNFKYINDYYGHEIGDYVLIEFSKWVSTLLEGTGQIGRFGGDEFIVLVPYQTQQQVEDVASGIVSEMQRPIEIQQATISIMTSIGIALVEEDVAIRNMLKCADDALISSKGKREKCISCSSCDGDSNIGCPLSSVQIHCCSSCQAFTFTVNGVPSKHVHTSNLLNIRK